MNRASFFVVVSALALSGCSLVSVGLDTSEGYQALWPAPPITQWDVINNIPDSVMSCQVAGPVMKGDRFGNLEGVPPGGKAQFVFVHYTFYERVPSIVCRFVDADGSYLGSANRQVYIYSRSYGEVWTVDYLNRPYQ